MPYIPFSFPNVQGVDCYFQFRSDTNSLRENTSFECSDNIEETRSMRSQLFSSLGIKYYSEVHQVHGVESIFSPIVYEGTTEIQTMVQADGMATERRECALVIKTADCQALLITEKSGTYIMALHVGWRGNATQYIQKAIGEFCTIYGISPQDILAVRSPSLSPSVAEFIHAESEFSAKELIHYNKESKTMDLWAMTRHQLVQSGLKEENIYGIDICTYSSPHFFSYRRDRSTGRQISMIILRDL